jgi:hypothetical protein
MSTPSNIVRLNVGGVSFATTLDTLSSPCAGTLAAWFTTPGMQPTLVDDEGRLFVDRDGRHFGKILNYLRDGSTVIPMRREDRAELRKECEYYNITGLLEALDSYEESLVHEEERASLATASLMSEAAEALAASSEVMQLHQAVGVTRQTDLAVRLPALQLKMQAEVVRLLNIAVRAGVDVHY